jgi:hypothetical protein
MQHTAPATQHAPAANAVDDVAINRITELHFVNSVVMLTSQLD